MNVSRNGHIEYQIPRNVCLGCPFQNDCIKIYNTKTITRHLYGDCIDLAKQLRLSKEGKEIYKLRKQSCYRVFADGKERHGLCFTRFKGLQKNVHMRGILYACMNIKKYALLIKERANNMTLSFSI